MKRFITICLVFLLCATAYGTTIQSSDSRITIGAMTGPRTGAEQDDNIKASLDLLHAKMAATMNAGGSIFYVDSGVAGSAGTSWGTAVGTIELAIALCTDAAGDLILVAPYHAETASIGTFDLNKDSVTIWALGTGIARGTITYDTNTDTVLLGADGDNCTIHGLRFVSSVTAVACAIVVEAGCTDWIIEDCEFSAEATTVDEFIDTIYVTTGAADRGIIRRCRFLGDVGANAGPKSSINFIDCDFLQIYDCEFSGDIGDAHIFGETTASNYVTIRNNRIMCGYIGAAGTYLDTTPGISLVATTTGWIQDNFVVTNVDTPEDSIVAAHCYLSNNYYSEDQAGDQTAVLIGQGNLEEKCVMSLQTTITDTNNLLFTIAGGPIKVIELVGIVETNIEAKACVINYLHDPTSPTGVGTAFGTAAPGVEINGDAAGTIYTWDGVVGTDLTATTGGVAIGMANGTGIILPVGSLYLQAAVSTSATGAIRFYMRYLPLDYGITVKAD